MSDSKKLIDKVLLLGLKVNTLLGKLHSELFLADELSSDPELLYAYPSCHMDSSFQGIINVLFT